MTTIKAILFDMFDTLMLIEKNHEFYSPALVRMFKFLNNNGIYVSLEQFIEAYMDARKRINAQIENNYDEPHFNVRVSETLKNLGFDSDVYSPLVKGATDEFCKEFMNYVHSDSDAKHILKELYGKYKLGIVSNFAIPECVFNLLKLDGLADFFDTIVVSASINIRKPSPEIFHHTLKILGVSVEEAIFVGDTIDSDIEGAKAIGMKAIYIERRHQKSDRVVADRTIKNLSELPMVLEQCCIL